MFLEPGTCALLELFQWSTFKNQTFFLFLYFLWPLALSHEILSVLLQDSARNGRPEKRPKHVMVSAETYYNNLQCTQYYVHAIRGIIWFRIVRDYWAWNLILFRAVQRCIILREESDCVKNFISRALRSNSAHRNRFRHILPEPTAGETADMGGFPPYISA